MEKKKEQKKQEQKAAVTSPTKTSPEQWDQTYQRLEKMVAGAISTASPTSTARTPGARSPPRNGSTSSPVAPGRNDGGVGLCVAKGTDFFYTIYRIYKLLERSLIRLLALLFVCVTGVVPRRAAVPVGRGAESRMREPPPRGEQARRPPRKRGLPVVDAGRGGYSDGGHQGIRV